MFDATSRRIRKLAVIAIGFVAGIATSLVLTEPEAAELDACTADCGPAPCCEVLWTTWCGCPWGEEQEID